MKITIETDDGCKVTAEGSDDFIRRIIEACKLPVVSVPFSQPQPIGPYLPYTIWTDTKCPWCGKTNCTDSHIICGPNAELEPGTFGSGTAVDANGDGNIKYTYTAGGISGGDWRAAECTYGIVGHGG